MPGDIAARPTRTGLQFYPSRAGFAVVAGGSQQPGQLPAVLGQGRS